MNDRLLIKKLKSYFVCLQGGIHILTSIFTGKTTNFQGTPKAQLKIITLIQDLIKEKVIIFHEL